MLACLITYLFLMATIAIGEVANPASAPTDQAPVRMLDVKNSPALVGGRIADSDELPFSVFIGICSASIVGPEVILTAGHCLERQTSFNFNFDGRTRRAVCTRHPQFNNNTLNNDFALCTFSPRINDEDVFADVSPINVDSNDQVTLQGFGQNRLGTLQVGNARIVEINNQDIKTNASVRLGGGG